jgi:alpha-beta hydrolase superfamily lysophospholipase
MKTLIRTPMSPASDIAPLAPSIIRRISVAVAAIALVLASACRDDTDRPAPASATRETYSSAIAMIARRQAADDSIAVPGARSILLTTGKKTPRAIVLLHGLTDSPRQFEAFAYRLYADGDNVYVPRLPEHGLIGGTARMLGRLTAAQLRGVADSVVDEARGLGDSVIVVGLSMGGTIAAWIAQHDVVARAVLIAPAIEPGRIPALLDRPIIGLATRLPSMTRLSPPDTARPDREVGFNTRAVAEILSLGESLLDDASRTAPGTRAIAVLVNASDRTVRTSAAESLASEWARHGAAVSVFELPDSLRLPHNIIDPLRGRIASDAVFALLRELTYGQPPPGWVAKLAP